MHITQSDLREILQYMLAEDEDLSPDITDWDFDTVDTFVCRYLSVCTEDSRYEIFAEGIDVETDIVPDYLWFSTKAEIELIKIQLHQYLRSAIEIPISDMVIDLHYEFDQYREAEHNEYRCNL